MARRSFGLRIPGPSASLALALSILCALFLSGTLPSASATHASKKSSPEAAPAPALTSTPAAEPPAATKPAVKHRAQGRGPNAAAGPGGGGAAPATGPEASRTGTTQSSKSGATRTHVAEKRAKRAEEKAAQKTSSEGAAGSPGGVANPQTQAGKSKHEREREREQKRRERKAEKEGSKETKKEREAREARESEEAARQPTGAIAASAAPVTTPVATSTPAQTATSPLPKIVGESSTGAGGPHRAAHSHKGEGRALPAAAGALAAVPVASTVSPAAQKKPHRPAASHTTAKASGPGSQIVKTVTRIIGVVPPLLWLLVGALGVLALAFAVSSRLSARRARLLARHRITRSRVVV